MIYIPGSSDSCILEGEPVDKICDLCPINGKCVKSKLKNIKYEEFKCNNSILVSYLDFPNIVKFIKGVVYKFKIIDDVYYNNKVIFDIDTLYKNFTMI